MLTTRLWMGSVLIALAIGMLAYDQHTPFYPFQFVFQIGLAIAATYELVHLLGRDRTVIVPLAYGGILTLTATNWLTGANRLLSELFSIYAPPPGWETGLIWTLILAVFIAFHLLVHVWEMATFHEPGHSFERMARTWWAITYLGLLPCFIAQIRWLYPAGSELGTTALALAIFVPKGCDIGAFCVGKLAGRHSMTPILSPNKTWEGAIGGLAFASLIAVSIDRLGPAPALKGNLATEIAFGLSVGLAGMVGDLSESLVKRDCHQKDASHAVPGFGGILDIVDSVIFAAPVAYFWFLLLRNS